MKQAGNNKEKHDDTSTVMTQREANAQGLDSTSTPHGSL
jgi:hypothetical protein